MNRVKTADGEEWAEQDHYDLPTLVTMSETLAGACREITNRLLDEPDDCRAAVLRLLEDWRQAGSGWRGFTADQSIAQFLNDSPQHRQALADVVTPISLGQRDETAADLRRLWQSAVQASETERTSKHNRDAISRAQSDIENDMPPAESLFRPVTHAAETYGPVFERLCEAMVKETTEIISDALTASATVKWLKSYWTTPDEKMAAELRRRYDALHKDREGKARDIAAPSFQRVPSAEELWPRHLDRYHACCRDAIRLNTVADELDTTTEEGLAAARELKDAFNTARESADPAERLGLEREIESIKQQTKKLATRMAGLRTEQTAR